MSHPNSRNLWSSAVYTDRQEGNETLLYMLTHVIDDDGNLEVILVAEDLLEEGRLARAEEPGEEGDGEEVPGLALVHLLGTVAAVPLAFSFGWHPLSWSARVAGVTERHGT